VRSRLLLGIAGLATLSGGMSEAWGQRADVAEEPVAERVVVVGSRGAPRMATETPAPVDVFSGEELTQKGFNELTKVLEFLSPSFNYPRAASGPSTQGARPATLRGLGPDQVLVLVNGHRRHASSLITFNNTVGRGTVPIDFNTIPLAAIERVEVLRDGAAAQYGSDAIAGVINIVLKEDDHGGFAEAQYGETQRGQGETKIVRARQGLAIGDSGFVTVSGEFNDRDATNAAQIDPRYGRITSQLGDSPVTDVNLMLNAGTTLGETMELYGFLSYGHRDSAMNPLYRGPEVAPAVYPQGFLPEVDLELTDAGGAVGLKGKLGDWDWDLSDTAGYNKGDYEVLNTTNTSLGVTSPTRFDGGGARYSQNLVNLTVGREFGLLRGAHLSAGLEHRYEAYELSKGEPSSYAGAGAQGFPGFNPPVPVDVNRHALSAFVDGELSLIEGLDVGLAARYEDYSDFGSETTGKLSLFWRPLRFAAFRATASTGFRAPSLQQQYFSTVTSQRLPSGTVSNVGTFAVTDTVSRSLGSSALQAETATSYSAGIVLTPLSNLNISIDAYHIDLDDRIVLGENIQGPQVTAILLANGITNASVARFFTNAADTRNKGLEATARWEEQLSPGSRFTLTAGYGRFESEVRRLDTNPVLPQIALLGPSSILLITDAQPRSKTFVDGQLDWGALRFAATVTRFGAIYSPQLSTMQEGPTSVDLLLRYQATSSLSFSLGVINAGDKYPPRIPDNTGRIYSETSPLGFNGREYFAKVAVGY